MEQRFGVIKTKSKKKCNHWMCRKPADVIIGDTKQPHVPMNYWLCADHAKMLLEQMTKIYGYQAQTVEKSVETVENTAVQGAEQSKSTLDGLIRMLYANSGKISKTDIVALCKETGVELPENASDLKIKELIELLAPDITAKIAQEDEANV